MEAHVVPVSRKRRRFAWDSDGSEEESLDASSEGSSSRDEADESALDWESRERLHLDLQVRPSADYFELRKASVEKPETEVPRIRGRGAVSRRRKRLASLSVTEGRGAALQEAARQMRGRGFVLWPDFLGKEAAQRLAGAMRLLRGKPGRLGSVESRSLRGDLVAWPGEADSEQIRAALGEWQQAVDRLVADLRPLLPGEVELGSVDAREPAMLSCYPRGARYIRHYDNNCDTGEGDCNGRRLTVLYYLNEAVSDSDGGHLRLIGQRGGVYDILPELDALVLFWADRRTPHEVLPNLGKDLTPKGPKYPHSRSLTSQDSLFEVVGPLRKIAQVTWPVGGKNFFRSWPDFATGTGDFEAVGGQL